MILAGDFNDGPLLFFFFFFFSFPENALVESNGIDVWKVLRTTMDQRMK